jgi:spore coat protein U-like protein
MSRRTLTVIGPVCLVLAAAGWKLTPGETRANGLAFGYSATPTALAAHALSGDTLAINVVNTMPHRMSLSYENGDKQVPLGNVEGSSTTQVVLRDLQRDSVTVWGSAPQHDDAFKKTFAVHSKAPAVWQF